MLRVEQRVWTEGKGWGQRTPDLGARADLVLVFGEPRLLRDDVLADVRTRHPQAAIVGASSAGEIAGDEVTDQAVTATAVSFERTRVRARHAHVATPGESYERAAALARELLAPDLVHVLVFSDGTQVNGTEVVRGFRNELPRHVALTGGLAGDGDRFERTAVVFDGASMERGLVAVGLYGRHLSVGYGSLGGWIVAGGARRLTRSEGNVLLEIDGEPALDVYRALLGPAAAGLPASGLLHPLLVQTNDSEFVRTLVGVDDTRRALVFAGDVPSGQRAFFMRADFERLVAGASGAARDSLLGVAGAPELALLVSCVGRKLLLKEQTHEELAAVRKVLQGTPVVTGFYSYGEICPTAPGANCTLHNQTMTVTTLHEA